LGSTLGNEFPAGRAAADRAGAAAGADRLGGD